MTIGLADGTAVGGVWVAADAADAAAVGDGPFVGIDDAAGPEHPATSATTVASVATERRRSEEARRERNEIISGLLPGSHTDPRGTAGLAGEATRRHLNNSGQNSPISRPARNDAALATTATPIARRTGSPRIAAQ